MSAKRIASEEYEVARGDLARQFRPQFDRMVDVYEAIEPMITRKSYRIPREKLRGLGNLAVVTILFMLLAKALKTFRAIRVTALEGCGQDAAILLRALFETTVSVQWILQCKHLYRARLFAAHEDQRALVIVESHLRTPGLKRRAKTHYPGLRAKADAWSSMLDGPALASARKHWSGEQSLLAACQKMRGWAIAYHTVYRATSGYAHGADLLRHGTHKADGTPVLGLLPGPAEIERTTSVACVLLYSIASRLNERLGLGYDESLRSIKPEQPERR